MSMIYCKICGGSGRDHVKRLAESRNEDPTQTLLHIGNGLIEVEDYRVEEGGFIGSFVCKHCIGSGGVDERFLAEDISLEEAYNRATKGPMVVGPGRRIQQVGPYNAKLCRDGGAKDL